MQKKEAKHTGVCDNTASTRELYSQRVHTYRWNYLIVYMYVQQEESSGSAIVTADQQNSEHPHNFLTPLVSAGDDDFDTFTN